MIPILMFIFCRALKVPNFLHSYRQCKQVRPNKWDYTLHKYAIRNQLNYQIIALIRPKCIIWETFLFAANETK